MRRAPLGRALLATLLIGGAISGVPVGLTAAAGATSRCDTPDPCIAVHLPGGVVQQVSAATLTAEATAAVDASAANAVSDEQYLYSEPSTPVRS